MPTLVHDAALLQHAIELAWRGQGAVEPNPMVGCVIASAAGEIVGEGWHQKFGGPHAEVFALQQAGERARGATAYVTLEPCCHHGKTPPCSDALLQAGIARAVIAMADPFPKVSGGGISQLRCAGVEVEVGLLESESRRLNAPYLKLLRHARPWVIAKWAMTLDGRIATRTGSSRWISGEASRALVHALRGRVDAIIVGSGTARMDDPLLTARPAGPRTAVRVVADSNASLANESQLVRTACEAPVLIAAGPEASSANIDRLRGAGCEVLVLNAEDANARLYLLLEELGRRRMTNVLVEGGAKLLGAMFDGQLVDEVHTFIAPKIVGGVDAPVPIAGRGIAEMSKALALQHVQWQMLGDDLYLRGTLPTGE
jgi:diaminohydroxyphosphoribosylaminopyrimidine deaminase/5-amino-6-(5-phosphoribosylamino)uracil reductase